MGIGGYIGGMYGIKYYYCYFYYNFIYSRIIKIIKNMYIYDSQITNKQNKIKQK